MHHVKNAAMMEEQKRNEKTSHERTRHHWRHAYFLHALIGLILIGPLARSPACLLVLIPIDLDIPTSGSSSSQRLYGMSIFPERNSGRDGFVYLLHHFTYTVVPACLVWSGQTSQFL